MVVGEARIEIGKGATIDKLAGYDGQDDDPVGQSGDRTSERRGIVGGQRQTPAPSLRRPSFRAQLFVGAFARFGPLAPLRRLVAFGGLLDRFPSILKIIIGRKRHTPHT